MSRSSGARMRLKRPQPTQTRTTGGATYYVGAPPGGRAARGRRVKSREQVAFEQRAAFRARHAIPEPTKQREASYAAMRPSRLRRQRDGIGGTADAHLSTAYDYWRMREYSWAMDRDDILPGRWVNRLLDNLLPLAIDPQTGHPELNAEFKRRWVKWGQDPDQCDVAGKLTWEQIERLALRTCLIGGDAPAILDYEATTVQLVEPDRLASPDGFQTDGTDIVHGVEIDTFTGRPVRYHFLKAKPGRHRWNSRPSIPAISAEHYKTIEARDEQGRRRVLLIHDPERVSESRGVTIFHGGFDVMGMIDDTLYAELQKQQTDSCVPMAITSERENVPIGAQPDPAETNDQGQTEVVEQLAPGTPIRLLPGEKLEGFSNGGSRGNFEGFMAFLIRIAALQTGLPYSIVMLDTRGTTFHGYRGEFEQGKLTFRRYHRWYPSQLHRPVWRMLTERWASEIEAAGGELAAAVAAARAADTLHDAKVQGPAWPYVEPLKDANADTVRLKEGLAPARQVSAERGRDYDDDLSDAAADAAAAIRVAHEEATKLSKELGVEIPWTACAPGWVLARLATPAPGASAAPAEPEEDDEVDDPDDEGGAPVDEDDVDEPDDGPEEDE